MKKNYIFYLIILCSSIALGQTPVADFGSGNAFPVCTGKCVNFSDNSTNNPTGWHWTFPGGSPSSSTLQNPVVCYNSVGSYNVKMVVSNASGADSLTKTNDAVVNASPPQPSVTCSYDTICSSFDVSYISYQWQSNGTTIPGATRECLKVQVSAIYTIIVTNAAGCTSTTSTSSDCIAGLPEAENLSTVNIYPNPVLDKLYLFMDSKSVSLVIYNVMGEVCQSVIADPKSSMDVSSLSAGIYFVEVKGERGRAVKRFVKE